ncbi:MAG: type IV secretory system conjugative DNA transfer family protein [Lachnospiraceae bacterium]|nr:type IV secretory system conjugative DNA transfer family protein [Lachnospiraceae bacterium]
MDYTCLAEGCMFPADFAVTGLNLNELVVGATGCGKTVSTAYARLLHTEESSVVIPATKRAIVDQFGELFRSRGYEVQVLDFAHPLESVYGYDPMDYILTDEDVVTSARSIMLAGNTQEKNGQSDPYWTDSATDVIAAEIALIRLNAEQEGKKPCFRDVIKLHRSLKYDAGKYSTNLDALFDRANRVVPGCLAYTKWQVIRGLPPKTFGCILSMVNQALSGYAYESLMTIYDRKQKVSFQSMGEKKTALFLLTSPMNRTLQSLLNLLYADCFRTLFETAEQNENYRLKVPVHVICDDFACGSRIAHFEDYISVFRAAGISVTLLLQSESQLRSIYNDYGATTIINNCDTYVFMGSQDPETCRSISQRINKPVPTVMSLPLEQVYVFRRGAKPVQARRYQTFEDPIYKKMLAKEEKVKKTPAQKSTAAKTPRKSGKSKVEAEPDGI